MNTIANQLTISGEVKNELTREEITKFLPRLPEKFAWEIIKDFQLDKVKYVLSITCFDKKIDSKLDGINCGINTLTISGLFSAARQLIDYLPYRKLFLQEGIYSKNIFSSDPLFGVYDIEDVTRTVINTYHEELLLSLPWVSEHYWEIIHDEIESIHKSGDIEYFLVLRKRFFDDKVAETKLGWVILDARQIVLKANKLLRDTELNETIIIKNLLPEDPITGYYVSVDKEDDL